MTPRYGVVLRATRFGPRTLHHLERRLPVGIPLSVITEAALSAARARALGRDMDVELLLLATDDGALATPARAIDGCGVIRLPFVPGPPAYGPDRFGRPDHYLASCLLPLRLAGRVIGTEPLPLDRWTGHHLALRGLRAGLPVAALAPGDLVLPSLAQTSGRDMAIGRLMAAGLADIWGDAPDLSYRIQALGDLPDQAQTGPLKALIDADLSRLTADLLARLVAAPVARRPTRGNLPPAATIGVLKLDPVGDAILATPFLAALRRRFTGEIRLVAARPSAEFALFNPDIDRLLTLEPGAPLLDPTTGAATLEAEIDRVSAFLDGAGATVIPRLAPDYYLANHLAVLSGIPRRFGLVGAGAGDLARYNLGFAAMMTDRARIETPCHETAALDRLARAMGAGPAGARCRLYLGHADRATAAAALASCPAGTRIAIGLGAANPRRRWPAESVAALIEGLSPYVDIHAVLVGGADVRADGARIAARLGARATDLTGRLSLRETAAVISGCALYLGNDSSAMHMAAAAQLPVVELSCHPAGAPDDHENAPHRFGPIAPTRVILRPALPAAMACAGGCVADVPHCIQGIAVDEAILAARALLAHEALTAAAIEAA